MKCVYKISFACTDRVYIGSTNNYTRRRNRHKFEMSRGTHHNIPLNRAYLKYGEPSFTVLEDLPDITKRFEREQFHMDSYPFEQLYNILRKAGNPPNPPERTQEELIKRRREVDLSRYARNRDARKAAASALYHKKNETDFTLSVSERRSKAQIKRNEATKLTAEEVVIRKRATAKARHAVETQEHREKRLKAMKEYYKATYKSVKMVKEL